MSDLVPLRSLEEANILKTYSPARNRLLLFDYDGTLTNIVRVASTAIIPGELQGWLRTLAYEPKNTVWVISGRDQAFLQAQLGHIPRIGLVAEHGAFMRRPESNTWDNLAAGADMSWKVPVKKAFQNFVCMYHGSYIEEKKVAIVLHYRVERFPEMAALDAAACKECLQKQLERWPVEIINGKCVIEARPSNVDKGQIVQRITEELRAATGDFPEFLLCAGDDVTDEDMFHALRPSVLANKSVYTVKIGDRANGSEAHWSLTDPTELFATIRMLNTCDQMGDQNGVEPLRADGRHRTSKVLPVSRSSLIS